MSMIQVRGLLILCLPAMLWANTWQDLWLNKNQQAERLFNAHKNKEAAGLFTDSRWQGAAFYRDKNYQAALDAFRQDDSAYGLYNQGNALAQLQEYQKAIDAYKKALAKKSDFMDAKANIEYLENLLKQQEQKNQQNSKAHKNQTNQNDKENKENKEKQSQENSEQSKQDNQAQKAQENQQSQQGNEGQKGSQNKKEQNKKSGADKPDEQSKDSQNHGNERQVQQNTSGDKLADTKTDKNMFNDSLDKKDADKEVQMQAAKENKEKSTFMKNKETKDTKTGEKDTSQQAVAQSTEAREAQLWQKKMDALLSQIPDDPGGLLKQKFLRDYQTREEVRRNGENND